MSSITLYHASPSRSSVVLWMLEEVGAPYDIKLLKLSEGDQLKADYLAINPMGKVPALRHGDTVMAEVAAICAYLADEFPQAKLNIPVGDTRRGRYFQWLFYSPSILEPAMTDRAFPRKEEPRAAALGYRNLDTVLDVLEKAVAPGPFLLGERFTAADVVLGSGLRYGTMFKLIPERKPFGAYIERLTARPALKRAEAKDRELSGK
ncbi:MAG TPA: glutathione S-transferase family protein [Pseudolabrys sp.]|nr:glutathione S-transferase family protein [Pseudolabrys sp.]